MTKPSHFAKTKPFSQAAIDGYKALLDKFGTDESMPELVRQLMAGLIVEIENNPNAPEELKRQARLVKKRATG